MELSEQTQAVLAYFQHYTGHNVRKPNDVGTILETAAGMNAAEQFNALVFTGKCAWNVYAALRKVSPNDEGYNTLEREFAATIQTLREQLALFASNAPADAQARLKQVYLGMGQGTLRNVVDLAHDLARFKDMQHDQQRQ
jgi:hypothetical protein